MHRRRRNDDEVLRGKLGDESGSTGAMKYMAPSGGRYLVKNGDETDEEDQLTEDLLRQVVSEIVRKCGDDWCLYTKKKDSKTGKRRRLGTHSSKEAAYRQERAIKAHGG